jgi:GT2 family glycosyltransferase
VSVVAMGGADAALLASLRGQLAGRWEVLAPEEGDPFARARYPIVMVVEDGVVLERDALWHVLRAFSEGVGAVVWDRLRLRDGVVEVECGPAFDPDGFCARPVVGGAYAVRRDVAGAFGAAAAVVLRVAALHGVAQVPRVLHRVAGPERAVGTAELDAVRGFLAGRAAAALDRDGIVTRWPQPAGRTLVVVPTKNQAGLLRRCLESLFRTRGEVPMEVVVIDHQSDEAATRDYLRQIAGLVRVMPYEGAFDFARMNNLAVARFGGEAETLLFLNNDTEAIEAGWLSRMRGLAARAEVGAVGALLLYGDRRVQHAGVVLGYDGSATHAHALALADADGGRAAGHLGQLVALREVSAVTAACMVMRRGVFAAVGGFDEGLPIGFNDTDLCLRLRGAGYRILQDGRSVLFHHESRTRHLTGQWLHPPDTARFQARWAAAIAAGDPFYNPNLRLEVRDHEARGDCLPGGAVRVSWPAGPTAPGAAPAAAARARSAARRRR